VSAARKLLAVALQCVLLTMTVVGNSGACERMGTMPATDHSMPDSHQHHAPEQSSGQQPPAPDDCVLMTMCSLSALTVAAVVMDVPAITVEASPAARVHTPHSVVRAPEPPPPRA
jgi:hypothetical protein